MKHVYVEHCHFHLRQKYLKHGSSCPLKSHSMDKTCYCHEMMTQKGAEDFLLSNCYHLDCYFVNSNMGICIVVG